MTKTVIAAGRLKRCRYRRRNDEMCTAAAMSQDDDALVFLCSKHGARVLQMMAAAKAARVGLRKPA